MRDAYSRNLSPVPADLVRKAAHDFQLDDVKPVSAVRQLLTAIPVESLDERAGTEKAASPLAIDFPVRQVEALLTDLRRYQKTQQAGLTQPPPPLASAPQVSEILSVTPHREPPPYLMLTLRHSRNRAIRVAAVLRSKTREAVASLKKMQKRKLRAELWKGRPERALKALGHFLTNPMPHRLVGAGILDRWNRLYEFSIRLAPEKTATLREILAEAAENFSYLPEQGREVAVELFRCLAFVPDWILSPRSKELCIASWARHRQTYDSLMHWLRGPLPF